MFILKQVYKCAFQTKSYYQQEIKQSIFESHLYISFECYIYIYT